VNIAAAAVLLFRGQALLNVDGGAVSNAYVSQFLVFA